MISTTSDQCRQLYQQPFIDGMPLVPSIEGLLDEPMMTSSSMSSQEGILSPNNLHNTISHHHLTPKANFAFKPIRKRSRASKRTPFTLLKANTSNFRTLVQQFTGCPNTTTMPLAFHKGPITLNFQQGSKQRIFQSHTTRAMPPFGTTSFNQQVPLQKQQDQLASQQLVQEHVKSSDFLPTSGNPYSMEISDGLLFDNNDFSLHELTNTFSSNKDGFFMR
ncbi:hypothetical protein VNO77_01557 [Canavalia gladiata]|uniref:VQ domain-containing protein n=1 Tax=Canavalia gladiata TaxID=3824 RepID=A0AAN9MS35_CANGL